MNFGEMKNEVLDIVQDPSITATNVGPLLNRALFLVATGIDLPNLITEGSLTTVTNDSKVALPSDFHKKMFHVAITESGYEREIKSLNDKQSYKALLRHYPGMNRTGEIRYFGIQGTKYFHYQPIPSEATNLEIHYYKTPDTMINDNDEPDGLPAIDACQYILVHYAAWQLFEKIEDGIEGQKVNTAYHKGQFLECMSIIKDFVGEDDVPFNLPDESLDWIP